MQYTYTQQDLWALGPLLLDPGAVLVVVMCNRLHVPIDQIREACSETRTQTCPRGDAGFQSPQTSRGSISVYSSWALSASGCVCLLALYTTGGTCKCIVHLCHARLHGHCQDVAAWQPLQFAHQIDLVMLYESNCESEGRG